MEELMDKQEVCAYFRIKLTTLYEWERTKKIPEAARVKGLGRKALYRRSVIEAMVHA